MVDMEKDARTTFRLPQATLDALERAAGIEQRKVGNLLGIILADWLADRGYLPKPGQAKRRGKGR